MNTTSNAIQMNNRDFFRQREAAALCRIPGARELLGADSAQRPALEHKYPDAAFALGILSNPFVQDRELGSIRMDAYVARHNWD